MISFNSKINRLKRAYQWQKGNSEEPSYIDLRILEKQGLIYLYRDYTIHKEYEVEQGRKIIRPRIRACILMYKGRQLLGIESGPRKPLEWE